MKLWTIETKPVTDDERIYSTKLDMTEEGLYYVINGSDGYLIPEWTPYTAEEDYLSEENTEERQIDFMKAYGFYD